MKKTARKNIVNNGNLLLLLLSHANCRRVFAELTVISAANAYALILFQDAAVKYKICITGICLIEQQQQQQRTTTTQVAPSPSPTQLGLCCCYTFCTPLFRKFSFVPKNNQKKLHCLLCKTFMGFMQRIKVFIRCSYIKYYKVKRNLYRKLLRVYQIYKQKYDADKYKYRKCHES